MENYEIENIVDFVEAATEALHDKDIDRLNDLEFMVGTWHNTNERDGLLNLLSAMIKVIDEFEYHVSGLGPNDYKTYELVDHEDKKLEFFSYFGTDYKVLRVFKNTVLAIGNRNDADIFDIEDIMGQDEFVKGIK